MTSILSSEGSQVIDHEALIKHQSLDPQTIERMVFEQRYVEEPEPATPRWHIAAWIGGGLVVVGVLAGTLYWLIS